jgi:hypothetical protein
MLKLRSMMEDMAEKLFGRFLPQVKAQAHGSGCAAWEPVGCCGPNLDQWDFKQYCPFPEPHWHTNCSGICPT